MAGEACSDVAFLGGSLGGAVEDDEVKDKREDEDGLRLGRGGGAAGVVAVDAGEPVELRDKTEGTGEADNDGGCCLLMLAGVEGRECCGLGVGCKGLKKSVV